MKFTAVKLRSKLNRNGNSRRFVLVYSCLDGSSLAFDDAPPEWIAKRIVGEVPEFKVSNEDISILSRQCHHPGVEPFRLLLLEEWRKTRE